MNIDFTQHLDYLFYGLIGVAVLLLIFIILVIVQIKKINKLSGRLDKFLIGKDGASLEQDIIALFEDNKFLKINTDRNRKDINKIFTTLESTYQKMGLVKYDAFKQMGGKLSFCLALLDEKNNGYIINSVHSTDGCYSYAKLITEGESDVDLASEEAKALKMAIGEEESK